MGKMQREKGKRFERTVANLLKDYGYDTRRTSQYCGNTGDASDVVGLPGIHIECKHVEQMHLYDWVTQASNDSQKSGRMPTVFHKKNNADILVTMKFDDWIKLYKAAEEGWDRTWNTPLT